MKKILIGITGASGSILAKRLLEYLATQELELHLVATQNGSKVFAYETGAEWNAFVESISTGKAKVLCHRNEDLFAPVASGSFGLDAMVIVPCSMTTVGKVATASGDSLLCRAADVCLKERSRLVLVTRETPLHQIHLENLLTLSRCGAVILPPVPMFYDKRESYHGIVDGIVGRILKSAGFENPLYHIWRNHCEEL